MSNSIDQRVVEMRFENEQFEKGISTSLKSLDNLKKGLDTRNAVKGLTELANAGRSLDLSIIGDKVDYIAERFNIVGIMAQRFKEKIVDTLTAIPTQLYQTIEQFTALEMAGEGFQKFGQKTTSVGTLVSQGFDLSDVNEQISRLNWFADETSYSLTDMTENIAKFTASGMGLKESSDAMQGIALWAALSGQNAGVASRAMYQLSQALGSGVMRKEDYKSIQNMSMDTMEFRQIALDTAVAMGTLQKNADGTYRSLIEGAHQEDFAIGQFADHLTQDMWFTSDVMMEVYKKYGSAVNQIYDYTEQHGVTASEAIVALGDAVDAFGMKAFKAGQEARTWQDVVDATKDAVSSQWMQTWELIFGDYEEAKNLWTDLANELWDVFAGGGEERNERLADVLSSKWGQFTKAIKEAGVNQSDFEDAFKETLRAQGVGIDGMIEEYGSLEKAMQHIPDASKWVAEALRSMAGEGTEAVTEISTNVEELQRLVDRVIAGDFGNGRLVRAANFAAEGLENYELVQELVNEKVEKGTIDWSKFTKEELKSVGATDEQAEALMKLAAQAEATGTPLNELIASLEKPTGRQLLLESFWNFFHGIVDSINAVKESFHDIFPQKTTEQLYSMLEGLHRFSEYFVLTAEKAEILKQHFRGLFAAIDIVYQAFKAVGGALLSIAKHLLPSGDAMRGILGFTGSLADAVVAFDEWIKETGAFHNALQGFANAVNSLIDMLKKLAKDGFEYVKEALINFDIPGESFSEKLRGIADKFGEKIHQFWVWIQEEFQNESKSFGDKISTIVGKAVEGLAGALKGLLIAIDGNGPTLKEIFGRVKDLFYNIIGVFSDFFGEVDSGDVLDVISVIFQGLIALDIAKFLKVADGVKDVFKKLEDALVSWQANIRAETIQKIAVAIGILALVMIALSFLDWGQIARGSVAIVSLAFALSMLMAAYGKFAKTSTLSIGKKGITSSNTQVKGLISMATSLFIIAMAVQKLGSLDPQALENGMGAIVVLMGILGGIIAIINLTDNSIGAKGSGVGTALMKLSASIYVLANIAQKLGALSTETLVKGVGATVALLTAMSYALAKIPSSKYTAEKTKAMTGLSKTMVIMASAMWIMGQIETGKLLLTATIIGAALYGMVKVLNEMPDSKQLGKKSHTIEVFGKLMYQVGLAVAALGIGMKLIGSLGWKGLAVALTGLAAAIVIFAVAARLISDSMATKLDKLGWSMLKFGAGVMLMGIAMPLLAKGIIALSLALAEIAGAIILAAPLIADALIAIVVEAVRALSESVTAIVDSVLTMLHDVCAALRGNVGPIVADVITVVIEILDALAEKTPELVVVIIKLLGKIGEGLKLAFENMSMDTLLGLSGAIAILSFVMGVLSKMEIDVKNALKAAVFIGLTMAEMAAIFYLIRDVDGENLLKQSEGMSLGITAMAGALKLMSTLKVDAKQAFQAALALDAFVFGVGGIAAIVGGIINWLDPGGAVMRALDTAAGLMEKVGELIGGFFGGIISGFGKAVSSSLPVIGQNMTDFATNAAGFFEFLNESVTDDILVKASNLVGLATILSGEELVIGINNFFNGIGAAITGAITGSEAKSPLAQFAEQLTELAGELKDFADAMSKVKTGPLQVGIDAAKALTEIADNLPDANGSWLGFDVPALATFAGQLKDLGTGIAEFSAEVDGKINEGSVTAAANAASALAEMVAIVPPDPSAIAQWLGFDTTEKGGFSEAIKKIGAAMVDFQKQTLNIDPGHITEMSTAVDTCTTMLGNIATVASTVLSDFSFAEGFGGAMQTVAQKLKITSTYAEQIDLENLGKMQTVLTDMATLATDYDLDKVGEETNTFSGHLGGFADSVSDFATKLKDIETYKINAVIGALVSLVNQFAAIGTEGSTAIKNVTESLKIASETDWSKLPEWGLHLYSFGTKIRSFITQVEGLDETKVSNASTIIDKIKELDESIGDAATADWSLDSMGGRLENFGQSLNTFGWWLSGFDLVHTSGVMKVITEIVDGILALGPEGSAAMKDFGEGLKNLGAFSASGFTISVSDAGKSVFNAGKTLMTKFLEGLGGDSSGYVSDPTNHPSRIFFNDMMQKILDWLNGDEVKTDWTDVGKDLMTYLEDGFKEKEDVFKTAIGTSMTNMRVRIRDESTKFKMSGENLAGKIIEGVRAKRPSMYQAGVYLVGGLVNSLADQVAQNNNQLYNKGKNLAAEVDRGIRSEGQIKSPSRMTYADGTYLVLGLVNSLRDNAKLAFSAGQDLSSSSMDGIRSAISNVKSILESDIDTQPVIRPVLDDSEIQNGVAGISALFNGSSYAYRGAASIAGRISAKNLTLEDGAGTTYNFNQYNNSPKALDRLEIYRQTKNLLSSTRARVGAT